MPESPEVRRRPPRGEVRRRLLEAATTVFAARGIDGASLADVAAAAGLTKGAIYSNFPGGKDELVLALMDHHIDRRRALVLAAVGDGDPSAPGAAARIGDVLADALAAEPEWQRLFLEFWAHAQRDERLRERFAVRRREARAEIADVARTETARLDVRLALAPEEVAVTLLALSNGLAIERLADPSAVPDDLFGRLLALVLTFEQP